MLLVGNKADLEAERQVSAGDAKELARKLGVSPVAVSRIEYCQMSVFVELSYCYLCLVDFLGIQ